MADTKIFSIKLDANQYVQAASQIKTSIDALKVAQKELDTSTEQGKQKFVSTAVTIKSLSEQYNFAQKQIINLSESTASLEEKTLAVDSVMQIETKTINGLNTQNTALNKIKKNLNIENKDEADLIKKINDQLDSNTSKVKDNSSEVEKQKMNIGNYKSGVVDLIGQLKNGEVGVTDFIKAIWGMTKAFLASPIGWIALGIAGLISLFKTIQPIVDKVEQVFAGLNAVMKLLKDGIIGMFTSTDKASGSMKSLSAQMVDTYNEAVRLKKAIQDLEDSMQAQSVASAQNRAEIKRLETAAKNTALSYMERNNLLHQAEVIRQKDFGQRMSDALQEKNIAVGLLKTKAGVTQDEIYLLEKGGEAYKQNYIKTKELSEARASAVEEYWKKYVDSQIKISEMSEEHSAQQERNYNKQAANEEKASAERDKLREAGLKKSQEARDREVKLKEDEINLFQIKESKKAKTIADTFAYEQELMKKRQSLNEKNYEVGKITKEQFEAEELNIKNQYELATLEATAKNMNYELELWKAQNNALLESKGELNQQLVDAETIAQNLLYDKRKEIIDKTILDEQEKTLQLAQLEIERQNTIDGINAEWDAKKKENEQLRRESESVDYELKIENMRLNNENELLILDEKFAREKVLLKQKLEDGKLSEEQHILALLNLTKATEEEKTKIKEIQENSRLELASQTFSALANIFGKESAAGKAMAIAQTTIDTYQAAQKAYKSMVEIPVVGPTLAVIAAASAVATGLANVKKIVGVKNETKFAHGYIAGDRYSSYDSYSNDIIPALISPGEAVIPASVVSQNRELISGLIGSQRFANGYMASPSTSSVSNSIDITSQLAKIQVINVPEETYAVMNNVIKTKQYANV